jgi:hypothetical protein
MKDLAELIKQNPGAVFIVDNDCWEMRPAPKKPVHEMTDDEYDDWSETRLAFDGDVIPKGEGYGSGCRYGGDILQALAEIVGVKIESV